MPRLSRDLVTIDDAAEQTARSEDVLRRWARQGVIPATRIAGVWFLPPQAIAAINAMPKRNRAPTNE